MPAAENGGDRPKQRALQQADRRAGAQWRHVGRRRTGAAESGAHWGEGHAPDTSVRVSKKDQTSWYPRLVMPTVYSFG